MQESNANYFTWDNYCPYCQRYQSETGVCLEISENVRSYPKRFFKKCSGNYFIQNKEKPIVNENDIIKVKTYFEEKKPTRKKSAVGLGCGTILIISAIGIIAQHNILSDFKLNWTFALGEMIAFVVMLLIGIKLIRGKIDK